MSDDNVVSFRRKLQPIVWSDGRVQHECDDLVHLFESVPGRCQCGERLWENNDGEFAAGVQELPAHCVATSDRTIARDGEPFRCAVCDNLLVRDNGVLRKAT